MPVRINFRNHLIVLLFDYLTILLFIIFYYYIVQVAAADTSKDGGTYPPHTALVVEVKKLTMHGGPPSRYYQRFKVLVPKCHTQSIQKVHDYPPTCGEGRTNTHWAPYTIGKARVVLRVFVVAEI